jgi:hypothetical protein
MFGKQMMSQSNKLHHESVEDDPRSRLPATLQNEDNVRQLQEGCVLSFLSDGTDDCSKVGARHCVPQVYFWVYYSQ